MCGRLLLAYPLHLVCGALTGLQLVRHHLLEGEAALHWGWLLVPAILTHGTYDSVLFVLAAFMPSVAGASEEEEEEPRSVAELELDFWGMLEQLAILPFGWLYLAIPLYWMRRKLRQIDLPALYAKAVGESDGAGDQGASGGGGGGGDYGLSMGMAMQPPLSQQQQQGQEEEGGDARDRSLVPMLEASGGGGGGRDSLLAAGVI